MGMPILRGAHGRTGLEARCAQAHTLAVGLHQGGTVMKHRAEPGHIGGLSIFERSCVYCGARFRVMASHVPQRGRSEDYACPECGKHYETESIAEPQVHLLKPRSDGKKDRYQETWF